MIKNIFVLVLFILMVPGVLGTVGDNYCVKAEVSDISPSSIGINEEFTIGIHVENCGEKISEDVSFEIINLSPDITIKESPLINIGKLEYANSERFIVYHMKTSKDAKPGEYLLKTRLKYGDNKFQILKDDEIIIDVIGEEAELNIASIKTNPVLPHKGDTVELTLRIENFGEGTANSVKVSAEHPFQGIKDSFIGTLDSDEDGPAIFTFIVDRVGEFEFPVKISYEDDFGENEIQSNIRLIILKKKTNLGAVLLSLISIAVIAFLIFYFFKTKRAKDNIIQQLLRENHHKETKGLKKRKKWG